MHTLTKLATLFILFISCLNAVSNSPQASPLKVLFFSYVYNRPDFVALQKKTLDAFCKDPHELIVFNDAPTDTACAEIEGMCKKLDVRCVRVPQSLHWTPKPGQRHIDSIKFSFQKFGLDHKGIVVMLDADMFLIKPINVNEYMDGYDLIGGKQWREDRGKLVTYIAPGLAFFNMTTLPNKHQINFRGDRVEGILCDVGGHMYYYLQNNPSLKYRLFVAPSLERLSKNADQLKSEGFDNLAIELILNTDVKYGFEFHGDNHFLHYYAGGSNWPDYSAKFLAEKDLALYAFVEKSLKFHMRS